MFRTVCSLACSLATLVWVAALGIALVLAVLCGTARAQFRADSLRVPGDTIPAWTAFSNPNGAMLSFDHLLSIYEWHARSNFSTPETPAAAWAERRSIDTLILTADSRFLADDAIRSNAASAYFYADDALGGSPVRPMIAFEASTIASSGVSGLSAATLVPGETDGFGAGGIRVFVPGSNVDLSGAAGLAEQKQSGVSNAVGPIVRAIADAPFETVGQDGIFSAGAIADERFFHQNNERYSSDTINAAIANPIAESALLDSNHAYLSANLDRRDFFYTTDSSSSPIKQEWRDLALSLRDSLNYPISGRAVTATVSAALEPSSIERTSDISASELTTSSFSAISSLLVPNEISVLHSLLGARLDARVSDRWSVSGRMSYDDRTENVQLLGDALTGIDPSLVSKFTTILNESSYETRTTQAGTSVVYQPNLKERFQIGADANLLNYDTPSPLNDDDHDELIASAEARYDRFFSDELHGWFDLRAARTHLVYLLSDRSAQNNITQSLTLSTHANYATSALFASADGEVFANYTELDYLNSVPELQGIGDYVMRGLTFSDSVMLPLGIHPFFDAGPITLQEGAAVQVQERGSYDPAAFTEAVNSQITEVSASLTLGLASRSGLAPWAVQVGVRGFFLFNEGDNTESESPVPSYEELERQTRVGPVVIVSLLRRHALGPMLFGSLWYAILHDTVFSSGTSTRTPEVEAQLSAQWNF